MEYLSNWTDTSIIQQTGWSGSIAKGDKCLIFTATNGWRTFGWSLDNIVGKNICIEFDYIFTDVTNWSSTFIVNNDSIAYGDSYNHLTKTIDEWCHMKCRISSAKKFIGFNIRGVDSTGKSVVMKATNIRIHSDDNIKSNFMKNGVATSNIFLESNCKTPLNIGKDNISTRELYEI